MAIFEYIEGFLQPDEGQSSLGYLSPARYEAATMVKIAVA